MRYLAAISLCALATLVPTACGGADETTSTTPSTAASSTSSTTTSTAADTEPSELRTEFDELILESLTGAQGLTPKQARCAIRILDAEITDAQIEAAAAEIAETGEAPDGLIDTAFDAGATCSAGSGG